MLQQNKFNVVSVAVWKTTSSGFQPPSPLLPHPPSGHLLHKWRRKFVASNFGEGRAKIRKLFGGMQALK